MLDKGNSTARLGVIPMRRSRIARLLVWVAFPLAGLTLLAATWRSGDTWPLWALPPVLLLALTAVSTWDRVRGIELRSRGLYLDLGDGVWRQARPCAGGRISALAISLPCILVDTGRRIRLNIWRDAVADSSYRRLARNARHDRWPRDRPRLPHES